MRKRESENGKVSLLRRAPVGLILLTAVVWSGCEFYSPEYENPLDPQVSVPLEEVEFGDPDFAMLVAGRADGGNTNDVTYIDGDAQGISSLEGIQHLSNLRELRFWGESSVSSLVPVGQLRKLEVLQIDNAGITDLSPLSEVASLRELFVRDNNIRSLTPLSGLSNLRRLAVSGPNSWSGKSLQGGLEAIAVLTQLTDVEVPGFGAETLDDLSPILQMPNLEGLWLYDSALTEFPTSGPVLQLRALDVSWNPISTLPEATVVFPNMTELSVQGLQLAGDGNYARLSNISAPALDELRIGANWFDDGSGSNAAPTTRIPELSQYPELRRLSVRDSDLTDISGLRSLTNLESLDLENQQTGISDFGPLQGLSRLQWVGLGWSGFGDGDVQYLSGKSDLNGVNAGGNEGLVTLAGFASLGIDWLNLDDLPNLTSLNLSYIDHIDTVNLRSYGGEGGPLAFVSGGSGAGIRDLSLGGQSISDITALGNLTTLRRLQLSGNPIAAGVRSLARLTNLEYLDLTATGVAAEDVVYLQEQLPGTAISW